MATLDRAYFNALNLTPVKRKYYDKPAVDAVLVDIRIKADALNNELEGLRKTIAAKDAKIDKLQETIREADAKRMELGDAVLSAHATYNEIIEKADGEAERIIAEANSKRAEADKRMENQQDYAIKNVEEFYSKAKENCEAQLEELNMLWQRFLCGLDEEAPPADLKSKIGRIASEVREIDMSSGYEDK